MEDILYFTLQRSEKAISDKYYFCFAACNYRHKMDIFDS